MTTLRGNVIFGGPRAGVEFTDAMVGGHLMEGNLLFDLTRETTDHGPFNSWGRVPFVRPVDLAELSAPGRPMFKQRMGHSAVTPRPAQSRLTRNMIICNWECTWPIDHDDGSQEYHDSHNLLYYGGAKNFLGRNKNSSHNIYM